MGSLVVSFVSLLLILLFIAGFIIRFLDLQDILYSFIVPEHRKNQQDAFLSRHFGYYSGLSRNERAIFIRRVNYFISAKRFEGRQGFEITPDVKLIVAASAVQLTFGLRKYTLPGFPVIFIYPDVYFNRITGNYHKGEVNQHGLIVLSWKYFVQGYKDLTDKLNLGLHEMAHALFLTILRTDNHDSGLDGYLNKVINLSPDEITVIKASHFFRDYAGTNIHEFFAVVIEHFFEAATEFQQKLPVLYNHLCRLLNQNPAKKLYRKYK